MSHCNININQYDYALPESLIAQFPAEQRTSSRLLVVEAGDGYRNLQFTHIIAELNAGDLLVVNDTRVLPARVYAKKPSGGKVEIMLERVLGAHKALVMLGANKPLRTGQELLVGDCTLVIGGRQGAFFELLFPPSHQVEAMFERWGTMPLPPYITRDSTVCDNQRYQTVYAKAPGAVAAPTAGLHFDEALIEQLQQHGVDWGSVTLHVGAGTFQPVLYPGYTFNVVDALITNFHLPKSTLLMMVSAFAGYERVMAAYRYAIEQGYRFYSYGDAMFLQRQ